MLIVVECSSHRFLCLRWWGNMHQWWNVHWWRWQWKSSQENSCFIVLLSRWLRWATLWRQGRLNLHSRLLYERRHLHRVLGISRLSVYSKLHRRAMWGGYWWLCFISLLLRHLYRWLECIHMQLYAWLWRCSLRQRDEPLLQQPLCKRLPLRTQWIRVIYLHMPTWFYWAFMRTKCGWLYWPSVHEWRNM